MAVDLCLRQRIALQTGVETEVGQSLKIYQQIYFIYKVENEQTYLFAITARNNK